jgi:hypothetical protein
MDKYDYGMGLLGGLQKGLGSYFEADKARKDREMQLGLLRAEKGLIQDPNDPGKLIIDPEFQERKLQEKINEGAMDGKILERGESPGLLQFKGFSPEYVSAQREIYQAKDPTGGLLKNLQAQKLVGDIGEQKAKVEEKEQKQVMAAGQAKSQANVIATDLDKIIALTNSGEFSPGLMATAARKVPGTTSYDVEKLLDTVKANVAFNKLQEMRASSPTGGALGAVSDREMGLLQSVLGSLDTSTSKEQFLENVTRLRELQDTIINKGMTPEQITQFETQMRGPRGLLTPTPTPPPNRKIVKKQINRQLNKTRVTYSDGTVEELDGIQ